jgi:hypothetical protein
MIALHTGGLKRAYSAGFLINVVPITEAVELSVATLESKLSRNHNLKHL